MGRVADQRSGGRLNAAGIIVVLTILCAACGSDGNGSPISPPPPPPPPAPTPLALQISAGSRNTAILVGDAAPPDSVTVSLTGDESGSTAWTATARQGWTTLTTASGTGSGKVRWNRDATGLAAGIHVDTITITAPGAATSPLRIFDTLQVTLVPVPLTVAVDALGRHVSGTTGGTALNDSVAVTITGTGAAQATWSATKRRASTTLTTAAGTGSGLVRWSRSLAGLAVGRHVDTLLVTVAGAAGSPARIIDTLDVTEVPPVGVRPDLGLNASLKGLRLFPERDLWNQPVDTAQVDANSLAILTTIGLDRSFHPDFGSDLGGQPFGIPYMVVPDNTPRVPVLFDYADESDPGPYPIPANPPVEGDGQGDAHILLITRDEFKLYELFYAHKNGSQWTAGSGAIFDLVNGTQRPAGWTSADAAGLPILPGLVRYDEVYEQGEIRHALRFTVSRSRQAYVPPATHWASSRTEAIYPPMGMRIRLKASFDISGYPAPAQVILRALKRYGMMLADNGSDLFVTGTADARWNDEVNNTLKQLKTRDFEVVRMQGIVTP